MLQTINTNEKIPEYFYVFCNFKNILCNHNLTFTKQIVSGAFCNFELTPNFIENYINGSQKYWPFVLPPDINLSPSLFCFGMVNDYSLEYNIELYRYTKYSKLPSRLSALYAFGDLETCIKVSQLYGWDISTVRKFKLKVSDEIKMLIRISKHNMEVISYMRGLDCRIFDEESQKSIYDHYWTGKANLKLEKTIDQQVNRYDTGEIYEYLIEGILELVEN